MSHAFGLCGHSQISISETWFSLDLIEIGGWSVIRQVPPIEDVIVMAGFLYLQGAFLVGLGGRVILSSGTLLDTEGLVHI